MKPPTPRPSEPYLLKQREARDRIIALLQADGEVDLEKVRRLAAEDVALELQVQAAEGLPARNAITVVTTWVSVIRELLGASTGEDENSNDGFDVLTQTQTSVQQITAPPSGTSPTLQMTRAYTETVTSRRSNRLSDEEKQSIRTLLLSGSTQTAVARVVGVSIGAVNKIAQSLK